LSAGGEQGDGRHRNTFVRDPNAELVANLAWGGPDFRTLYLTATHSVYAIPVKAGPFEITVERPLPDIASLRPAGGKRSSKRDLILSLFLRQQGHLSADDLFDIVRREDSGIARRRCRRRRARRCAALRRRGTHRPRRT